MLVLVACGGGGESSITYDVKTKDQISTGPANFEQIADVKPSVDVVGPAPAYTDAVKAVIVAKKEAAKIKVDLGQALPSGGSGDLEATIAIDVAWWELPNITAGHADLKLTLHYRNSDVAAIGKQVGEVVEHYLDGRRPKKAAVPVAAGPAKAIAVGQSLSCSLHADSSVHCWGLQIDPLVADIPSATPITKAVEIAAGDRTMCARLDGGDVKCLGIHGDMKEKKHTVAKVCGLDAPTKLALGAKHSACAIVKDGKVRCWNAEALDAREASCAHASKEIEGVTGATAIALGEGGGCALAGGKAMCWKEDESKATAAALPAGTDVAVGFDPCVLEASGQVTCVAEKGKPPKNPIAKIAPGSKIAIEALYGCGLADGKLACWGTVGAAQGGSGAEMDPSKPQLEDVAAFGASIGATCAVKRDGSVWCRGKGASTGLRSPSTDWKQVVIY